ncbi:hypothetical protein NQ176_g7812 [Zarea fungicola]|uniref:Uncharacterized protein n=1 Tax=Zarea fungicola TaxID=93591 RepID=A0ACC1MWJ4_9HYPO|nr:hypothetical protein NQ176_g7812 [Lecanicillium fungicola]
MDSLYVASAVMPLASHPYLVPLAQELERLLKKGKNREFDLNLMSSCVAAREAYKLMKKLVDKPEWKEKAAQDQEVAKNHEKNNAILQDIPAQRKTTLRGTRSETRSTKKLKLQVKEPPMGLDTKQLQISRQAPVPIAHKHFANQLDHSRQTIENSLVMDQHTNGADDQGPPAKRQRSSEPLDDRILELASMDEDTAMTDAVDGTATAETAQNGIEQESAVMAQQLPESTTNVTPRKRGRPPKQTPTKSPATPSTTRHTRPQRR